MNSFENSSKRTSNAKESPPKADSNKTKIQVVENEAATMPSSIDAENSNSTSSLGVYDSKKGSGKPVVIYMKNHHKELCVEPYEKDPLIQSKKKSSSLSVKKVHERWQRFKKNFKKQVNSLFPQSVSRQALEQYEVDETNYVGAFRQYSYHQNSKKFGGGRDLPNQLFVKGPSLQLLCNTLPKLTVEEIERHCAPGEEEVELDPAKDGDDSEEIYNTESDPELDWVLPKEKHGRKNSDEVKPPKVENPIKLPEAKKPIKLPEAKKPEAEKPKPPEAEKPKPPEAEKPKPPEAEKPKPLADKEAKKKKPPEELLPKEKVPPTPKESKHSKKKRSKSRPGVPPHRPTSHKATTSVSTRKSRSSSKLSGGDQQSSSRTRTTNVLSSTTKSSKSHLFGPTMSSTVWPSTYASSYYEPTTAQSSTVVYTALPSPCSPQFYAPWQRWNQYGIPHPPPHYAGGTKPTIPPFPPEEIEEGLDFKVCPAPGCATEVTMTIEPDEDDLMEYAMDNGVMPVVAYTMPPSLVPLNDPRFGGTSGLSFGQFQYPQYPQYQQCYCQQSSSHLQNYNQYYNSSES